MNVFNIKNIFKMAPIMSIGLIYYNPKGKGFSRRKYLYDGNCVIQEAIVYLNSLNFILFPCHKNFIYCKCKIYSNRHIANHGVVKHPMNHHTLCNGLPKNKSRYSSFSEWSQ